jgi:hypothetical protein
MAFKAKYGHCDVSRTGENSSLWSWCNELRASYIKIKIQVSSCVGKRHFSVVCVCILICYGCELCLEKACMRNAYFKR